MTKIQTILIPTNSDPVRIDVNNVPKNSTKAIMSVLNLSTHPVHFDFELGSLYASEPSAASTSDYNAYASQLLFKLGVTDEDGKMKKLYGPSLVTGPLATVASKKKRKVGADGAEVPTKVVTYPSSLESDASATLCGLLEEMTGVDMLSGKAVRRIQPKKNAFAFFQDAECARITARLAAEHVALCDRLRSECEAKGEEFVAPKERKFNMSVDSKIVRDTWAAMGPDQRAEYEARAKVDEQRWLAEKEERSRTHPTCPVNVRFPYAFFVSTGNNKPLWATMTDEEKAPYVAMSKKDEARLEAELAEYKVFCDSNGLDFEYETRNVRRRSAKSGAESSEDVKRVKTGEKRKRKTPKKTGDAPKKASEAGDAPKKVAPNRKRKTPKAPKAPKVQEEDEDVSMTSSE